jgi:hypothetical protein
MMNKNMIEATTIEQNVMRRVRLIRILGLIISTGVFAALAFVAALWGIGREVWVARVFENGPQDFLGRLSYWGYAFLHTRFIVQALSLASLASLLFLVREVARFLSDLFAAPRA